MARFLRFAFSVLLVASVSFAGDPAITCESGKLKEAGKYGSCRLSAVSKAVKNGVSPDFSKCEGKFADKWPSIEAKGAGACPSEGDQAIMEARIQADAADIALLLSGEAVPDCDPNAGPLQLPATGQLVSYRADDDGAIRAGATLSYVDNGDGTITDLNTGLVWEKLSDDGSIHDWENGYSWYDAFDEKIAALNAANFAGYNDWRVPNVKELQGIVDYSIPSPGPTVSPAFNTNCALGCTVLTCSCTASSGYWSSTTYAGDPFYAWVGNFYYSAVYDGNKFIARSVRAVRGGS